MESIPALLPSLLAFLYWMILLPPDLVHGNSPMCDQRDINNPCYCNNLPSTICRSTQLCAIRYLPRPNKWLPTCSTCSLTIHGSRGITWTGYKCQKKLEKLRANRQKRISAREEAAQEEPQSEDLDDTPSCDDPEKVTSNCRCDQDNKEETCTNEQTCVELKLGVSIKRKCQDCGAITEGAVVIWSGQICVANKKEEMKKKEEEEKNKREDEKKRKEKEEKEKEEKEKEEKEKEEKEKEEKEKEKIRDQEEQRRKEEKDKEKEEKEEAFHRAGQEEEERMSDITVENIEDDFADEIKNDLAAPACEENPEKTLGKDCLPFEYIIKRLTKKMKSLGYTVAEATINGLDTTGGAIIDGGGKVAEGVAAATPYVVKGLDATGGAIIAGGGKVAEGVAAAAPYVVKGLDATGGAIIAGGGKVAEGVAAAAPYVVKGLDATGGAIIAAGGSVIKGMVTVIPYVVDGLDAAGEALIDGASLLAKGAVNAAPYVRDGAAAASSSAAQGVAFIAPHALNAALTGAEKLGDAALTGAGMIGNAALAGGGAAARFAGKAFTPSAETTDQSKPGVISISYWYDKASGAVKAVYHSLRGHTEEKSDQATPDVVVLEPKRAAQYEESKITKPCEVLSEGDQNIGVNCIPANDIIWRSFYRHIQDTNIKRARFH